MIKAIRVCAMALAVAGALGGQGCGTIIRNAVASAGADTVQNLVEAVRRHPDPELVRQGLPFILLTIDTFVIAEPNNQDILLAATQAYVFYAQAFLTDEDSSDRAAKFYDRAREYGMRLLDHYEFFKEARHKAIEEYQEALQKFTEEDVPNVHAVGAAWLGWIVANNESMAALTELPKALALMERALELDEEYADGAAHIAFGIFNAIQPRGAGQDLEQCRVHFERAIEISGPGSLLPRVVYAEQYGKAALDEEFFTTQLKKVLATDVSAYPENRFLNELAREQAIRLLDSVEDIF